jgi:hypothetical protein
MGAAGWDHPMTVKGKKLDPAMLLRWETSR